MVLSCKRAVGGRGLFVGFPLSVVLPEVPFPGCSSLGPGYQEVCGGPGAHLSEEHQCAGGEATSALSGAYVINRVQTGTASV